MLSERSVGPGESFSEVQSRHRRLADVKRGTAYTRTVDRLADRHWNAHAGIPVNSKHWNIQGVPATSKQWNVQGGISETSKQMNVRGEIPVTSKVIKTNFNFNNSSRNRPGSPGGHISLPSQSPPMALNCEPKTDVSDSEDTFSYFNTWGSRSYDLDNKLEPETKPSLVLPKRGVMMSRVAKGHRDRQVRTMTNFRSRNGTIRIVEPVNRQPSFQHSEDGNADSWNIDREQTYVMLKRIDEILHPAKMYFKSDLSSSEIEILSGESIQPADNSLCVRPTPQTDRPSDTVRGSRRVSSNKSRSREPSLALVVSRLDKHALDAYQKCQIWINTCPTV